MPAGPFHRLARKIDPGDAPRHSRQVRGTISRPAARIEHAFSVGERRRERVAGHVLVPQIPLPPALALRAHR